jgi:hypothetical protein
LPSSRRADPSDSRRFANSLLKITLFTENDPLALIDFGSIICARPAPREASSGSSRASASPELGYIKAEKRRSQMTKMKLAAIACLCMSFVPSSAYGDEWDKKTIFTFNAPVEVPGQVLQPGSYVFKLLNTQADRHVVQVFNKDQNKLIGGFAAATAQTGLLSKPKKRPL